MGSARVINYGASTYYSRRVTIVIDLTAKGFCVFGLRGAGKSVLIRSIASGIAGHCLYYDTMHECSVDTPFDFYQPKSRYSDDELQKVVKWVMQKRHYKALLIDEANRFCPTKPAPLPQAVADLNDMQRHYGLTVGYIARRPVQLHQDLTELAAYIFCYTLHGKNDLKFLDNLKKGLGDVVSSLPPFHFVAVDQNRNVTVHSPVNL